MPALFSPTNGQSPTVSVVIPTLNEARNLPHVLPRIPDWVDEVLIVDGHSTDDTIEVARQLLPSVRVLMQEGKGKGDALRMGFAHATGDIVVMLDADGSTDPGEIPLYVGALLAGADFVKGSRFVQGGGTSDMSLIRRLGNKWFVTLVQLLLGGNFSDLCYGYNAFWRRVLPQLAVEATGFEVETAMNVKAIKAGLRIAEVPSFEAERIHGASNLHALRDGWRVVKVIVGESFSGQWARPPERPRHQLDHAYDGQRPLAQPSLPHTLEPPAGPWVRLPIDPAPQASQSALPATDGAGIDAR